MADLTMTTRDTVAACTILVTGPAGTGKASLIRAVSQRSARAGRQRFRLVSDDGATAADVVAFVVDARAAASYQEARRMLAAVTAGMDLPLVMAIDRCDDPGQARSVADYLGAGPTVPAIACQLVDPPSVVHLLGEIVAAMRHPFEPADGEQEAAG